MKQRIRLISMLLLVAGFCLALPSSADEPKGTKPTVTKQPMPNGRNTKSTTSGGSNSKPEDTSQAKTSKSAKVKSAAPNGAAVYKQFCASCHADGGNSVKPGRPVAESSKVANIGIFKEYLSAPPGHMPYYEPVVNNKKTLQALFKYCQSLKRKPIKQATELLKDKIKS